MNTDGAIKSGIYLFSSRDAFKAAKLAYKVELARQEVATGRPDKFKALRHGLKAFRSHRVSIPELNPSEPNSPEIKGNYHQEVTHLVGMLTKKNICARQLTPYEIPAGFKWRVGQAQDMPKHIVVRNWVDPRIKDSSRHSALSIKDTDRNIHDYVSLVPGDNGLSSSNRILQSILTLRSYFKRIKPDTIPTYAKDKYQYIAQRARSRLVLADEELSEKQFEHEQKRTESLRAKATFRRIRRHLGQAYNDLRGLDSYSFSRLKSVAVPLMKNLWATPQKTEDEKELEIPRSVIPFATQKKNSKTKKWERRAQKVYLPCQGFSSQRPDRNNQFTMFGLNFDDMRTSWKEFKSPDNPDFYYRPMSKYNNCSGAALRLLKIGGCDHYLPIRPILYTDQKIVERYSNKLVQRLDSLNMKSDFLIRKCNSPEFEAADFQEKEALQSLKQHTKEASNKQLKKQLLTLAKLANKLAKTEDKKELLTPIAVEYVEALSRAFEITANDPTLSKPLTPALSVFVNLRRRMMQVSSQFPDGTNDSH
ncbi:hypothetical protein EOPP23_10465 [Endozoicomonas sp. OPT23]|uniref:hypothetical protein n=1 Tax=Endozoicomonas sp. OPT23 TaxID=2072845 RepID=UPI00129BC3F6|nr:hypothetical protein [Endozoicomonas sp. OPT23]MRI33408.1 hypothetical protein [Endozoicomonas sp. OPT23]